VNSDRLGESISGAEVTQVSPHGIWILVGGRELYASFTEFPWFRDATIGQISRVELPSANHLYWPELDIDLTVESLVSPADYPLVSRVRPVAGVAEARQAITSMPRDETDGGAGSSSNG
jgi:hypothetical protein